MKKIAYLVATLLLSTTAWAQDLQSDCNTVFGIASVSQTSVPAAAFEGKFSVSADKLVKFSPGNLTFHGIYNQGGYFLFSENQWTFANNTCCNCTDGNAYTGLFGYGTSGFQEGLNQDNPPTVCWGDDFDDFPNRMAPQNLNGTNYDWGVQNPIKYGDKTYDAGLWRTLTKDEWQYLLSQRPNFANLRSAGKVNGIVGMIILPDNWTLPNELTFYPLVSINQVNQYGQNTYTIDQWNKMQNAGAIFLPAACNGTVAYMTATQENTFTMYRMEFPNDAVDPGTNFIKNKNDRSPVRLVQDCK